MSEDPKSPTSAFHCTVLPIEGSVTLLRLDGDQLEFFRSATGIKDVEKLKQHIVAVQRAAYAVRPYPCIVNFNFANLRMTGIASYDRLLKLGRSRAHPIMLDVGSCLGTDLRKLIADGYPRDSVIATDIVPEFWELGQKLFNTTNETFPVPFVPGDLFDPSFLDPAPPAYAPSAMSTPKLSAVRTLTELRGHVSAMTVCAVFHVFRTADMQLQLARALGSLLSPEPGSMIVGRHNGLPQKGFWRDRAFLDMFCHSPESWEEMWDGVVFEKGTVKVEARLVEKQSRMMLPDGAVGQKPIFILEWSVTRV